MLFGGYGVLLKPTNLEDVNNRILSLLSQEVSDVSLMLVE